MFLSIIFVCDTLSCGHYGHLVIGSKSFLYSQNLPLYNKYFNIYYIVSKRPNPKMKMTILTMTTLTKCTAAEPLRRCVLGRKHVGSNLSSHPEPSSSLKVEPCCALSQAVACSREKFFKKSDEEKHKKLKYIWFFAHLFVPLTTVEGTCVRQNERKILFLSFLCSLIRTFVPRKELEDDLQVRFPDYWSRRGRYELRAEGGTRQERQGVSDL